MTLVDSGHTLDQSNEECYHKSIPTPENTTTETIPQTETFTPINGPREDQPIEHRRSTRVRSQPHWIQDYVVGIVSNAGLQTASVISDTRKSPQYTPNTFPFKSSPNLEKAHMSFLANISNMQEPLSYNQACRDKGWINAMHKELKALEKNDTWEITNLPKGKKPVGSKWVYKTKLKPHGSVDRLKARLVAKGYHQTPGIDYHDSFSPVAKLVTIRLFITITAAKGWFLHQLDIHNAFLHGTLKEEIYMLPPEGYNKAEGEQVCRLKKSIYGL